MQCHGDFIAVTAVTASVGAAPGDFMAIHTAILMFRAPATSVLLSRDGIGDTPASARAVKADILMPTATLSHKISVQGPANAAAAGAVSPRWVLGNPLLMK